MGRNPAMADYGQTLRASGNTAPDGPLPLPSATPETASLTPRIPRTTRQLAASGRHMIAATCPVATEMPSPGGQFKPP